VRGVFLSLLYVIVIGLVLERLGVPLSTLVAPAAALGRRAGIRAQTLVQDLLAGFFIVSERQYDYGDHGGDPDHRWYRQRHGDGGRGDAPGHRLRTLDGEVVFRPEWADPPCDPTCRATGLELSYDIPVPASADVSTVTKVLRGVGHAAFTD